MVKVCSPSKLSGVVDSSFPRTGGRPDPLAQTRSVVKPTDEPGLICYDIESWLVLHELSPEDDGEPSYSTINKDRPVLRESHLQG